MLESDGRTNSQASWKKNQKVSTEPGMSSLSSELGVVLSWLFKVGSIPDPTQLLSLLQCRLVHRWVKVYSSFHSGHLTESNKHVENSILHLGEETWVGQLKSEDQEACLERVGSHADSANPRVAGGALLRTQARQIPQKSSRTGYVSEKPCA